MELTGKIIAVLPERSGVSPRTGNEWKMASYVLETIDQYPRRMVFEIFGADRISQFAIQLGETMTVSFDIDAREYQGRWFNSIRAWKVDRNLSPAPVPDTMNITDIPPYEAGQQSHPTTVNSSSDLSGGVPFSEGTTTSELPF